MTLTRWPTNRRTNVTVAPHGNPQRDTTRSESHGPRAGVNPDIGPNSDLRIAFDTLPVEPSPSDERESGPPKIRFHVHFLGAHATSPRARENLPLDHIVWRIIAHYNAAVPNEYSRMANHDIANPNEWALSPVGSTRGILNLFETRPIRRGKSIPFLFP
jgi:hypothetical protein